jgi:hypothetical protein
MPRRKMKIGSVRKHKHFRVTITYIDNETSGRVYNNREKAQAYCERQEKSPVVKKTKVEEIK